MADIHYVNKQEAETKGLTKKGGVIYKKNILEIWQAKGWLELSGSRYSSMDRLHCGLKLALDYQMASRGNLHSGYIFNNRIDGCGGIESAGSLAAKDRYAKTIKAVPAEFWPVVRRICIEDKEPVFPVGMSERQKNYFSYMNRIDLCRGLDRIIEHNLKLKGYKNYN